MIALLFEDLLQKFNTSLQIYADKVLAKPNRAEQFDALKSLREDIITWVHVHTVPHSLTQSHSNQKRRIRRLTILCSPFVVVTFPWILLCVCVAMVLSNPSIQEIGIWNVFDCTNRVSPKYWHGCLTSVRWPTSLKFSRSLKRPEKCPVHVHCSQVNGVCFVHLIHRKVKHVG